MKPVCLTAAALCLFVLPLAAQQPGSAVEARIKAAESGGPVTKGTLRISGIYPHLAAFNQHEECGIGAVVPWAGQLWWITYPPHMRMGSNDKLYSATPDMTMTVHPESVGGTHAARMIHAETGQLFIGPYCIDSAGTIRTLDVVNIPGRYTAYARHLVSPATKLYLYDMEGPIWEVDTRTLTGTRIFVKPQPGWHGKGAYTAQGRLVIANNGNEPAGIVGTWELPMNQWQKGPENTGVLAEWNGTQWSTLMQRQFTDVTGPGGIRGNAKPEDPLWAMGWDARSVILMLLDQNEWRRFRLPKASHAMDPKHGWYTEWPRIREIGNGKALMCMHGMFYDFPLGFSAMKPTGIRPIASHLRYVPDFCDWEGRLVLAADDTSILENPLAGQSQSNLWFGKAEDLKQWGPGFAFGGVWLGDQVEAGVWSDPFLFAGFKSRMVHLTASGNTPLDIEFEILSGSSGQWEKLATVPIYENGYSWHRFPDDAPGEWIRLKSTKSSLLAAYFHYGLAATQSYERDPKAFAGFSAPAKEPIYVRPAAHNRNLEVFQGSRMLEVNETMAFLKPEVEMPDDEKLILKEGFKIAKEDAASLIVPDRDGSNLRLPRFSAQPEAARQVREVQSERTLAQWGGIFYEIPRGEAGKHVVDTRRLRPVSAHSYAIHDFCTWRGLLVMTGVSGDKAGDGHVFAANDGQTAIWAGNVDDLWSLGKPKGEGGPWKDTAVKAGKPSDPYLMTGFDRKTLTITHDSRETVNFVVEVDYSNRPFWKHYTRIQVPPGKPAEHVFPDGYSAHWARLVPSADCKATAWFKYE